MTSEKYGTPKSYTLDRGVVIELEDLVPSGTRSRFVNDAVRKALWGPERVQNSDPNEVQLEIEWLENEANGHLLMSKKLRLQAERLRAQLLNSQERAQATLEQTNKVLLEMVRLVEGGKPLYEAADKLLKKYPYADFKNGDDLVSKAIEYVQQSALLVDGREV